MDGLRQFDVSAKRKRIGHITPSSNTALEPITGVLNLPLSDRLSHHFTRIAVKQLTLGAATSAQFTSENFLAAAELLADCEADAIVWNGTSGSWLGIENDERFCDTVARRTGIRASTSTLAFTEVFRRFGMKRIALAVPYTQDLTERIANVYEARGLRVVAQAHLGQTINLDIGRNSADTIARLLREANVAEADCIAVVCTNLAATPLVEHMEAEIGKPIIDSIAVTFWEACRLVGVEPRIEGWGALLRAAL
jgi:maleate isomerase